MNGDRCTVAAGHLKGSGTLMAEVWSSPTSTGQLVTTGIPQLHLGNGEMITVAFVPKGSSIPEPPSRTALLAALGTTSKNS